MFRFFSNIETDKYFPFIYIYMYINSGVSVLFLAPKLMLIGAVSVLGWFSRLFLKKFITRQICDELFSQKMICCFKMSLFLKCRYSHCSLAKVKEF